MSSSDGDPVYAGGMPAILKRAERRRARLSFAPGEGLPGPDTDLSAWLNRPTPPPGDGAPVSGHDRKLKELQRAFQGLPDLCCLHGLVIAHCCQPTNIRYW